MSILGKILGRTDGETSTRTRRADGSTIGLSTPVTIRGNTVMGPSGGRATHFATTTASGDVVGKNKFSSSDWAQTNKGYARTSRESSKSSGGSTGSTGQSSASRGGTGSRGEGYSGRGTGGKHKAGGLVGKKNWIKDAIGKPGSLRSSLKVKKGEKIPAKKLAAAAKKPGKLGQRARLAATLKSFKKAK